MAHYHRKTWTERAAAEDYPEAGEYQRSYDLEHHAKTTGFRNAHTSLGVAGHIVHMGAMLFPVLAAELITDAAKYRKTVRIGAVATTVLYEGLYTMREAKRKHRQEEKLAEYREQAPRGPSENNSQLWRQSEKSRRVWEAEPPNENFSAIDRNR